MKDVDIYICGIVLLFVGAGRSGALSTSLLGEVSVVNSLSLSFIRPCCCCCVLKAICICAILYNVLYGIVLCCAVLCCVFNVCVLCCAVAGFL